ncbi:hypothetical protein ACYSNO_05430 [Enterococcus sp. LJL98]
MQLVSAIIFLFISHIYLEKRGLPDVLEQMKLRFVFLLTLGFIFLTILLGRWLPFGDVLVMSVTVSCSTAIAFKYRNKIEKIERRVRK